MREEKPRRTLAEIAAESACVSGRLVCPRCECADFKTYGTNPGHVATFRYKRCRHCGMKMLTSQQPEQLVRVIEENVVDDIDDLL